MYEHPRYGNAPTPGVSVGACPSCPAQAITDYYGGGCVKEPVMTGAPFEGFQMAASHFLAQPAFTYQAPYAPYAPPYQPYNPGSPSYYPYSPAFSPVDGPFLDRYQQPGDMYNSYYPSYASPYEATSFPFAYEYQAENYPYLAQSYS